LALGFDDLIGKFGFKCATTGVDQTSMFSSLNVLVDFVFITLTLIEHFPDRIQVAMFALEILKVELVAELTHIFTLLERLRLFFDIFEVVLKALND